MVTYPNETKILRFAKYGVVVDIDWTTPGHRPTYDELFDKIKSEIYKGAVIGPKHHFVKKMS